MNFVLLILCIFLKLTHQLTNALNKIQFVNCILLCGFVSGCVNHSSRELIIRQLYLLFLSISVVWLCFMENIINEWQVRGC